MQVLIEKLEGAKDLPLPSYMSDQAAGMDLYAAIPAGEIFCLKAKEYNLIPTGIKLALPAGFEAQIRPRSGLALKYGVTILNSPGTIDADYRGEIKVLLVNFGKDDFLIRRGDRIAQMIISFLPATTVQSVAKLPPSKRGEGGFGHTGTS